MEGRADLHTHTKHSGLSKVLFLKLPDAISEPEDVVRAAEARGLQVLCVTDHNTIRGGLEARKHARSVEVVVGEEVGTSEGEVLGLFLTDEVPQGLTAAETIDIIHSQGGVAVAPHPFSAHCKALGKKALTLDLDGIEAFNSAHRDRYANDLAEKLCGKSGMALTGGSDAHCPSMVGNAYTTFEGSTAEELKKALLARKVGYGGNYTPLKDMIWMTTEVALRIQQLIGESISGKENTEDTIYAREVYEMRTITKALSFIGIMAFLAPPLTVIAGIVGDHVHWSKSKAMWLEMNGGQPER
ncbi:MAG: PHP domain-containing protein [Thermoplasmata archaeon]|jgi:hypothetical protein|nr:PHP domain-containing protein [Thermoplasmata archaeon]